MATPHSAFRTPHSALGTTANLVEIIQPDQNIPRLGPIRGSQDPGQFKLIDDAGGATVPDAHAPLQQRGRAELVLNADFRGLAEQGIAFARGALLPLAAAIFSGLRRLFQRRYLRIDAGTR